ncbi:MAG: chemotaxis protein CheW [bacterium]|nr:chemotaxis protein CheW [bacterium]
MNGREFTLSLDPTQCKFGKWLATFTTDDPRLPALLLRARLPHDRIHAMGREVLELAEHGHRNEALAKIEQHRSTVLSALVCLLDEVVQRVRETSRQVFIVLKGKAGFVGLCVDSLSSVVHVDEKDVQPPDGMPMIESFKALIGSWTNPHSGAITRLLDVRELYPALALDTATPE